MFEEDLLRVIDRLCSELSALSPSGVAVPWAAAASALAALLAKYPTGVTWPLALAAVQSALVDHREAASAPPALHRSAASASSSAAQDGDDEIAMLAGHVAQRRGRLDRLHESRNADFSAVYEARIVGLSAVTSTASTLVIRLLDSADAATAAAADDGRPPRPVEMYLHQKLYFLGPHSSDLPDIPLSDATLRMTGCRLLDLSRFSTPRLLPTDLIVIGLDPARPSCERFLARHFGEPHLPRSLDDDQRTIVSLSLRVIEQSVVHQVGRRKRVAVYLRPHGAHAVLAERFERFILQLWDDHTLLAALLGRGDVLHIYRPYVSPASARELLLLECGTATVLFASPPQKDHPPSQMPIISQAIAATHSAAAAVDCRAVDGRLCIADVRGQRFAHVTLLARVARRAASPPTLWLRDDDADVDEVVDEEDDERLLPVRFVGFDAAAMSDAHVGAICLVEGIVIADSGASPRGVCSRLSGGRLTVLDALAGLLNAPFCYAATPIAHAVRRPTAAAVIAARVSTWSISSEAAGAVDAAAIEATDATWPLCVSARLSDGSGASVWVAVGARAAAQLLGVSSAVIARAAPAERQRLFDATVGVAVVAVIVPSAGGGYRLSAVCEPPPGVAAPPPLEDVDGGEIDWSGVFSGATPVH